MKWRDDRDRRNAYAREFAQRPEQKKRRAEYYFKQKYGRTLDELAQMWVDQEGLCAICHAHCAEHVDHDHATGRVRGLLCATCNQALGALGDNLPGVLRAVAYLERAS